MIVHAWLLPPLNKLVPNCQLALDVVAAVDVNGPLASNGR